MPVAAKLSRKFYDRFGDDVANELVDLLNVIDATYRSELREINDASWARFDAKLEQRIGELRAELKTDIHALRAELGTGIHALRAELGTGIHALDADMKTLRAEIRGDLKDLRAEMLKWMFLYWSGTALAGLLLKLTGWIH